MANKKLGPELWLASRNGELEKVKDLVARGAPVNFKYVSRKPRMRPYPLHIAVFRNRLQVIRYLLSQGADPELKNYRKENAFQIAQHHGHMEAHALMQKMAKVDLSRESTVANRNRDIKQIRNLDDKHHVEALTKEELLADSTKFQPVLLSPGRGDSSPAPATPAADPNAIALEKLAKARAEKEEAIKERKRRDREKKAEEERLYLEDMKNRKGKDKEKHQAYLELQKKREEQQRLKEERRKAREEEKRKLEEEGRRYQEEMARKREEAAKRERQLAEEERLAREEFKRKEREAVEKAKQRRAAAAAAQTEGTAAHKEEEATHDKQEQQQEQEMQASSPPKQQAATETLLRARYPYKAQRDDELSFKKGDIIVLTKRDPKGKWHHGRLKEGGDAGRFPANYVKEVA